MVRHSSNSFADGQNQNIGNVITGVPTTRVLKPPGGHSSISLGWDVDEAPQEQRRGYRAPHLRSSCAEVGGRGNFKVGWPATSDLESFEARSQASRGQTPQEGDFRNPGNGYANRGNGYAPASPRGYPDDRQHGRASYDQQSRQSVDDHDLFARDDRQQARASYDQQGRQSMDDHDLFARDDRQHGRTSYDQQSRQSMDDYDRSARDDRQHGRESYDQQGMHRGQHASYEDCADDHGRPRHEQSYEQSSQARRQFQQEPRSPQQEVADARYGMRHEESAQRTFGTYADRGNRVSSNHFATGANQNCGNMITERPTTRVVAPPGGKSTFSIGWADDDGGSRPQQRSGRKLFGEGSSAPPMAAMSPREGDDVGTSRGYRPSIRTSAPPGGGGAFGTDWSSRDSRTGPPAGRGEDEAYRYYQAEGRRLGKHSAGEQHHMAEKEARDTHRYHLETGDWVPGRSSCRSEAGPPSLAWDDRRQACAQVR